MMAPRIRHSPRSTARPFKAVYALTLLLMCLTLTALAHVIPTAAFADAAGPQTRWSLSPADTDGPDGRRFIEDELDPGESASDHIALHNLSANEMTFQLTAADGYYTREGRFDTLTVDQASTALGAWITIQESVTVPPGETVTLPFTITVPVLAEPGDYSAGITASIADSQQAADGTRVDVQSRVGLRVSTRVRGTLTPSVALTDASASYEQMWNPARPGAAVVTVTVRNDGNTRLLIHGTVTVGGQHTAFPAGNEKPQELLPGDTRSVTVRVPNVWPTVVAPASVLLTPDLVKDTSDIAPPPSVTADLLIWVLPLPQLLVLIGLGLVASAMTWRRASMKRKIAGMIEAAHTRGRQDALDGSSPSDLSRRGG